jgi:hypothetical protein
MGGKDYGNRAGHLSSYLDLLLAGDGLIHTLANKPRIELGRPERPWGRIDSVSRKERHSVGTAPFGITV